jgi:deazaflavin-dependent oxidoreductase (nitroreductase family)
VSTFAEIPWIAEHIELYKTDPEKAHMWDSTVLGGPGLLPTLLLTTTGRKSGKKRSVPLIYKEIDGAYVIIASKGGMPNHPVWFLNLEAEPACDLMVGAKSVKARARVAEGEERQRLWSELEAIYPPYKQYQENAGERVIPVVVLDPVA